jgi:hypothetical protein
LGATTLTNCQGRPWKLNVLNPADDSTTFSYPTFVTYDNATATISVLTNAVLRPTSFYVKVRYYDEESPTDYYDHPIYIRVIQPTTLTLSASDIDKCF